MTTGRYTDNIKAVIRCPRTTKMIFRASANYSKPYKNIKLVGTDLLKLYKSGFLKRQELPSIGQGKKEFIYCPAPKAKFYVPELEDIHYRNPIYRGITERSPWHSIATSDFISEIERSSGDYKDRIKMLTMLRPREFEAKVTVKSRRGEDKTKLIPDYTLVIEVDGTPKLFFVEVQIQTPVIIPISDNSISRSFQYKLTRYKVFNIHFRTHPIIKAWEEDFNCQFDDFQVMIVTTRGEQHLRNLMRANKNPSYKNMFLFTTTKTIADKNIFLQPIWKTSSSNAFSLLKN